jgi:raffinose synthase
MPGPSITVPRDVLPAEEEAVKEWKSDGATASEAGELISYPVGAFLSGSVRLPELPPVRRWLALGRRNIYWMGPAFGRELSKVAGETQFLLLEHGENRFRLILPLLDGDLRFCLEGGSEGLSVAAHGDIRSHARPEAVAAFMAEGACPFTLVRDSIAAVARHLKTFLPRAAKASPAFLDQFGWCTWNAFYDTVTAEKITDGLRSWQGKGMMPGLLIVDDGWLDRCGDYLNTFSPAAAVFPDGLSEFSAFIRRTFGVRMFGIWHAFQGYWGGINPRGPLGGRFRTVANRGKIRPWEEENARECDLFLVHPEEAAGFYAEFYRYLKASGIDFVKVDGQSATEVFSHGVLGRVGVMKAYQQAFQTAGVREFGVELLHCMAHGNDVIWHCRHSNAMRSSDDYRPAHDDSWQKQHIHDNAYNSLLIGEVATPDWDMFQSHRPHSPYHAAARALSGGPIYVSDVPGQQDAALLEKLVWFDDGIMRPLRCPQPARVTRDRLLSDCREERRLLKIFNQANGIGLLGLFHVHRDAAAIEDCYRPSDIEELDGEKFAVWRTEDEKLRVVGREESLSLRLEGVNCELVVISPIRHGVALLGLLDKFNAPAGLRNIFQAPSRLSFEVLDGGRVGIYCAASPSRVQVDGEAAVFAYDISCGLLVVVAPVRRISSVRISWT